jgi:Asp-tRNA(Asn)/Glu-tRNA(Gln) amidotransferase A subunit family amidase
MALEQPARNIINADPSSGTCLAVRLLGIMLVLQSAFDLASLMPHEYAPMTVDSAAVSSSSSQTPRQTSRRAVLQALAALGIGSTVFQRALAHQVAENGSLTAEMIRQAEWIAGLELTDDQRAATAQSLERRQEGLAAMRRVALDNAVPPALHFQADPRGEQVPARRPATSEPLESNAPKRPAEDEQVAMLPLAELAALIRTRQISSTELTRIYLDRLTRYNDLLKCVVTFTDDLALKQARRADREIAAGRYRGPLHGIPWGAKDLIAYPPYPTTWGAPQYEDQVRHDKATVARRLDDAGAVLVAKLTLGALAMGDKWFGGQTRNPWNPEQGSSGSSAGSAAAVAAGLVGFALGSETLGSIVSPCRRCGSTGLRPTFGRVSRYGCMALSWSMDKIGPIARSVEDCALVFSAIHGADQLDPTALSRPFSWPTSRPLSSLRVGYFERQSDDGQPERPELETLRSLGVRLVPIELPDSPPANPAVCILNAEAATAFDDLLRAGNTEGLNSWPGVFRTAEFLPAVEYIRANRIRWLLIEKMRGLFESVDLYVGGNDLVITNLTGHPCVVLPNGLRQRGEHTVPTSLTFTGNLFGESELLTVAHAYQQKTGHHLEHPNLAQSTSQKTND